jgi:sugar phosphate permease
MNSEWQMKIKKYEQRRWIIWLPLALAFLAPYFHRTATGVVADSLMREFSITQASEMGGLASVYFYIYAAMQIPAGIMADFFGPRRTITIGLLIATVGAVIFAGADSIIGLYVGRIFSSLGVSLIYVNIVKIHAEWFRVGEFATMTGLLVSAGSAGFLLATTPLAFVVDQLGWRVSFLVIAVYSLVIAILCWLLVRDRPTEVGLPSIVEVEMQEGAEKSIIAVDSCSVAESLRVVIGNPYTWWPFFASVTVYGVYMAFMGLWGVPYFMQVYGMSRVVAANNLLIMAVGTMVGGPLIGVLSDRLGLRRAPNIWFSACFLIIWLVLTLWNGGKPPLWVLYPICFGLGLCMSGVNLNVACGKEVNPPHMTGVVAGIVNSGSFVGAGLMQPAFGWLLDLNWQGTVEQGARIYSQQAYQSAFCFCAAILALGVMFTLMIKETKCVNVSLK